MPPQNNPVPRVYIDTSVTNVYLFGRDVEAERYNPTEHLFRLLDSRVVDGVISLYTIQEIYSYCQDNFPLDVLRDVIRLSIIKVLQRFRNSANAYSTGKIDSSEKISNDRFI